MLLSVPSRMITRRRVVFPHLSSYVQVFHRIDDDDDDLSKTTFGNSAFTWNERATVKNITETGVEEGG